MPIICIVYVYIFTIVANQFAHSTQLEQKAEVSREA